MEEDWDNIEETGKEYDSAEFAPVTEDDEDDSIESAGHSYRRSQKEGLAQALGRQWSSAPWYLGSAGIHLFIFCLLLLFAPEPRPPRKDIIKLAPQMIEDNTEELIEDEPEPDIVEEIQPEEVTTPDVVDTNMDPIEISTEFEITMPETVDDQVADNTDFTDLMEDSNEVATMGLTSIAKGGNTGIKAAGFANRGGTRKKSNLRKYGGDAQTEDALMRGLKYLARHQSRDGSWKLFPNENYFSGRFGFTREKHLPVHNDAQGMRHEFCMSTVTIPKKMTLAVSLDHLDDNAYIYINDKKYGPYPDSGDGADRNWKGEFQVNSGDKFRVEVVSTCVGGIWCVGRYWDAKYDGPEVMGRAPYFRTEAGLTALCTLAFLGGGNTAQIGKFKRHVKKAQEFLLDFSYTEFGTKLPAPVAYEAPIMIMALAELYGMDGDPRVKRKAQALIDMGIKYQLPNGGWPENMANDKEGSWHNTTWWLCALKSARLANLKVPQKVFDKSIDGLFKCIQFENQRHANIKNVPGYPKIFDGISKMEASMAVHLLNSVKGIGIENDKVKGMCELMVLAGTNRNGVWDWPGANVGFNYNGQLTYPAEIFESAAERGKAGRDGYTSYYIRSLDGFPSSSWGKPEFPSDLKRVVGKLSMQNNWYSATYWYWQGNSFSRLGCKSPYWVGWNNHFKPYLLYTQAQNGKWPVMDTIDTQVASKLETGDINGSWPGYFLMDGCGPFEDMGAYGATAFCCMMLEVYYRY